MQVMLVEDNEDLREGVAFLLRHAGRQVAEFASAEDALAAFRPAPCRVVVTDLRLPGMSGLALADRVHQAAPDTWVIVASGSGPSAPLDAARRLRFLTKPFGVEELDALITRLTAEG